MIVAGYYGITLAVYVSIRVSVCPSVLYFSPSVPPSLFLFLDDNLSKCQWILIKLGVCIDFVEIWFWIVNGQIFSDFDRVISPERSVFSFPDDNFSKIKGFSSNLVCSLMWRSGLGLANFINVLQSYPPGTCPCAHFWKIT